MNMKYLITALIVALLSLSTVGAVDIDAVNDAIISDNDNNTPVIPVAILILALFSIIGVSFKRE